MPVIRYNATANTNASDLTRRTQGRAVFANSLVNQKTLDLGCTNRVASGPAATTSYDGSKYIDQRVGTIFTTPAQAAEIVLTSPCTPAEAPPIVYPVYEVTCNDSLGIQILASGSFTKFWFTPTSLGTGVIEFQYFYQDTYVSDDLIVLGVDSQLVTPPPGIDEVRYVFRCSPQIVSLSCSAPSTVLQWTIPYSFYNPSDLSGNFTTLTLYKHPIGSGITETHTVSSDGTFTPTPAWGWDAWSISPCVGALSFPGTTESVLSVDMTPGLNFGTGDFTVEWYQTYSADTTNTYPTLFCIKTSGSSLLLSVYIDNTTYDLSYYEAGGANLTGGLPTPFQGVSCHIAVCRSGGVVYLYQNGGLVVSGPSEIDFSDETGYFFVGNDQSASAIGYDGTLTNFRVTVGSALYPNGTAFVPPSIPLGTETGTQLLLLATSQSTAFVDSSPAQRTVTASTVTWVSEDP